MNPGDHVPAFTAIDQHGNEMVFTEMLTHGPVVLFFYPKAMTTGCTKESCHFRDLGAEFAAIGAQRVGISADSVEKQAKFGEKNSLDYPLLSDKDRSIAVIFGVKRPGPLMNKRMTFVIGTDGVVLDVIGSEMNMDIHADQALSVLKAQASA